MGRLAIIGLDGATFRLLDPLREDGVMPALTALRRRGLESILRSTVPAYTPPAWVSIATGVNPGRHGVFGFLANTPQEAPSVVHAGLIDAPPLWQHLNRQGVEVGVFNVPITYPPQPVEGFMVSGGLAAGWTEPELPNFASDPALGRLVMDVAGGRYPLDTVVSYEKDWRSPDSVSRIHRVQTLRRAALAALLERTDPRVVFAVFEGPDRLAHLHYQYLVPGSDWYGRPEGKEIRARAWSYFAQLDMAIGDLVGWAGPEGHVLVVSDHGAGPWEKTVNVNLLLARWGYLSLPVMGRLARTGLAAGAGQRLARRVLPRRLLHRTKARMARGIGWERTRAFASHVAEQGIHVNERGTFPAGCVEWAGTEALAEEIAGRLMELRDPADGLPVVDTVVRRDDVIHGPHAPRAPHLFPFCRDQRYELSDTLAARAVITDHRDRPWGYHHSDGIFVAAGPGVAAGLLAEGLDVVDVLPTALHLAGLAVPEGLDGRVAAGAPRSIASRPSVTVNAPGSFERSVQYPFSPQEEAEIENSLRGLGYIE